MSENEKQTLPMFSYRGQVDPSLLRKEDLLPEEEHVEEEMDEKVELLDIEKRSDESILAEFGIRKGKKKRKKGDTTNGSSNRPAKRAKNGRAAKLTLELSDEDNLNLERAAVPATTSSLSTSSSTTTATKGKRKVYNPLEDVQLLPSTQAAPIPEVVLQSLREISDQKEAIRRSINSTASSDSKESFGDQSRQINILVKYPDDKEQRFNLNIDKNFLKLAQHCASIFKFDDPLFKYDGIPIDVESQTPRLLCMRDNDKIILGFKDWPAYEPPLTSSNDNTNTINNNNKNNNTTTSTNATTSSSSSSSTSQVNNEPLSGLLSQSSSQIGNSQANNNNNKEEEKEKEEEGERVLLKLRNMDKVSDVISFRLKKGDTLQKVITAYCKKKNLDEKNVRMEFDGERIKGSKTTDDYDMEEECMIDVKITA